MPTFDKFGETLRKHSGKILSGIGAVLVTPLIARVASRWTGRVVDKMWGADGDDEPAAEKAAEVSGGEDDDYEQWTKKELYSLAQDLDIYGRSTMTKAELIEAIREES